MAGRASFEWWPLYVRGLSALFGLSVLVLGDPGVAAGSALRVLVLLVLLFATGLLSVLAQRRLGNHSYAASHVGTGLELLIVSFLVHETGGLQSFFYYFYVPVLVWGTAGRGLVTGMLGGWTAAIGYIVAVNVATQPSFAAFPRAALLLLVGFLVGMIEHRRGEAEAGALRGARALARQANIAEEIRAALADMSPLDLSYRARVLLDRCLRLAGADHGLVAALDVEGRPVVEAAVPGAGGERPRGEVLPNTAVLEAVLRAGPVQTVVDAGQDARWVSVFGADAAGSALLLPLRSENRTFGALYLARRDVRLFTDEEMTATRALVEMAAVLLHDARMQVQAHDFQLSTVNTLTAALEAKDPYTRGHSQRVAGNAVAIASELGLPPDEVERIRWASLLHDIGKIATPEQILRKRAPLSEDERVVMNQHPERGAGILREMAPFRALAEYVQFHQEAYDGTGYPEGRAGDAIPLGARIIRVADTFDAIISDRPYRRGRSIHDAVSELRTMGGAALDPTLVEVFLRILKEKPPFEVQLRMWRER
jgi:putative nucleotidyltransferase with HDIG domain